MVQAVFITFVAPITAVIDQVADLFPGNTLGVSTHKIPAKLFSAGRYSTNILLDGEV
jgi:hypothetical protein